MSWVVADTEVSPVEDKSTPIIDADAELMIALRDEEYVLWMEVKAIRERHEKAMHDEMAPIKAKIKTVNEKMLEIGPKPACFGGVHCSGLPECGNCQHVLGCIRMVRSRMNGGSE